ncbi:MAG: hypothetical protein K8I00_02110, partial [Candidatus Omnitrophica bacterium]|nr:hypothetical protein [Candidatus Omnitrophota bacterium]
MTLIFLRVLFLTMSVLVGYYAGSVHNDAVAGGQIGFFGGLLLIVLERSMQRVSVRGLSSMVFGLLLGVFMAKILADVLSLLPLGHYVQSVSRVSLTLVFSYLGAVMA